MAKETNFSTNACFIVSAETPTLAKSIDAQTSGPHRTLSLAFGKEFVLLQPHQLAEAVNLNNGLNFRTAIQAIPKVVALKQETVKVDQAAQLALEADKGTYKQMKAVIKEIADAATKAKLQTSSHAFRSEAEKKQGIVSGNTQEILAQADKILMTIDKNVAKSMQEWQDWYQQAGEKLATTLETTVGIHLNAGEKAIVTHTTEKYKLLQEAKELGLSVETSDTEAKIKAKRAIYSALSRDEAITPTDPRIEQGLKKLDAFFQQEQQEIKTLTAEQSMRFAKEVDAPLQALQAQCKQTTKQFSQSMSGSEAALRQFSQTAQTQKAQTIIISAPRELPELGND